MARVLQGPADNRGPMTDPHDLAQATKEVMGHLATYQRLQDEKVQLARSLYESISTQVCTVWALPVFVSHVFGNTCCLCSTLTFCR